MRKIQLNYEKESQLAEAEIVDMEKLLEGESIFEAQEDAEDYTDLAIICFTFEDGMVPKSNRTVGTSKQFETAFLGSERLFTTKNINGYNVFISTERDDLYPLGYIIMNTAEFIRENPDGLYDVWVSLLNEVKS